MNNYSSSAYYGYPGCKAYLDIINEDSEIIYLGIQGQSLAGLSSSMYANIGEMGLYYKKKAAFGPFLSFGTVT